ncbi:hypothetical protein F66182_4965 [Fusarium sp. NRRL 66182]|nr:hypothetical protein F66182_4965 [Fusarium sp. NRRL 66182]
MPSYLITGASRGLGFEFLCQLSADTSNTVIGLVRNKQATDEKIKLEIPQRLNVHTVEADMGDYKSLEAVVNEITKITGGSLDYIIANSAHAAAWSAHDPIGSLGNEPQKLEDDLLETFKINTIGNIHLFNLFMPLIMNGQAKKVITISSGMADLDFISKFSIADAAPYSISKGAVNVAVAKFDAQYREKGILFMSISPGLVDTGGLAKITEGQARKMEAMAAKFKVYAPHFNGPISPEESAKGILSVVHRAGIEDGYGGSFVSHFGNKQWL